MPKKGTPKGSTKRMLMRARETPEQRLVRLAEQAASQRNARLNETADQRRKRLATRAARDRDRIMKETPEQRQRRLTAKSDRQRERRKEARTRCDRWMLATRIAQESEWINKPPEQCREKLTAQAAEERAQNERMLDETPEERCESLTAQTAEERAQNERMLDETPEERWERLMILAAEERAQRERRRNEIHKRYLEELVARAARERDRMRNETAEQERERLAKQQRRRNKALNKKHKTLTANAVRNNRKRENESTVDRKDIPIFTDEEQARYFGSKKMDENRYIRKSQTSLGSVCRTMTTRRYEGLSRGATIVAAYLMKRDSLSHGDALQRLKMKRKGIQPNPGFIQQLKLYEEMGWKIKRENKIYSAFLLTRLARKYLQNADSITELLEEYWADDQHVNQCKSIHNKFYKCKKCRKRLFTASHQLQHKLTLSNANSDDEATADSTKDRPCCSGYFIEPMPWMLPQILAHQEKLLCPNCKAKVGSFSWSGIICDCGVETSPGFRVNCSRVDECS